MADSAAVRVAPDSVLRELNGAGLCETARFLGARNGVGGTDGGGKWSAAQVRSMAICLMAVHNNTTLGKAEKMFDSAVFSSFSYEGMAEAALDRLSYLPKQ